MRRLLVVSVLSLFICGITLIASEDAFAKCEKALERLKAAEAELKAANAAYDAANGKAKQAAANLANAVANLNAVAAKLGVQGKATSESITFGRSPTNPAFFDDPGYKAAKQAWQDAKDANQQAEGELDQAGIRRNRAQDEYDDARKEYEKLRREHLMDERAGDEGLLLPPEPLEVDEKLSEKVKKVIETQLLYDSVKDEDTASDIGFVLTKSGERTILETSVLTTGKGANFRKWVPEKPVIVTKSGSIVPSEVSNYYAAKESFARVGASLIFAAIGTQYEQESYRAVGSKGTACSTTSSGIEKVDRGAVAKGIDRVGMAAGLGLLASQAGGDIKGLRATFDVTGREQELRDAKLRVAVTNKEEHKTVDVAVPVHFE